MGSKATTKYYSASPVANNGTITVPYPAGFAQADLNGSVGGVLAINGNDFYKQGVGMTYTFGASNITVTNTSGNTWAAAEMTLSFGTTSRLGSYNLVIGTTNDTAKAGNL